MNGVVGTEWAHNRDHMRNVAGSRSLREVTNEAQAFSLPELPPLAVELRIPSTARHLQFDSERVVFVTQFPHLNVIAGPTVQRIDSSGGVRSLSARGEGSDLSVSGLGSATQLNVHQRNVTFLDTCECAVFVSNDGLVNLLHGALVARIVVDNAKVQLSGRPVVSSELVVQRDHGVALNGGTFESSRVAVVVNDDAMLHRVTFVNCDVIIGVKSKGREVDVTGVLDHSQFTSVGGGSVNLASRSRNCSIEADGSSQLHVKELIDPARIASLDHAHVQVDSVTGDKPCDFARFEDGTITIVDAVPQRFVLEKPGFQRGTWNSPYGSSVGSVMRGAIGWKQLPTVRLCPPALLEPSTRESVLTPSNAFPLSGLRIGPSVRAEIDGLRPLTEHAKTVQDVSRF